MAVLGALTSEIFLREHWQQEPLLVRQALLEDVPVINAASLLALATHGEIESLLVTYDAARDGYRCAHGPFEHSWLGQLPAGVCWTLLVQAVDQWVPEVDALKRHFDFLPRWRLDDVMMSVAVEGGGVGPHFDAYDVFLIQLSGTREWRLGPMCDDDTELLDHGDLKLLSAFDAVESHHLVPGDLLYLPPGIAHWGVATSDDCVTCSVGFRAPSKGELLEHAMASLASDYGEQSRYRDALVMSPGDAYELGPDVDQVLDELWSSLDPSRVREVLRQALGRQVTESRYAERIAAADFDAPTLPFVNSTGSLLLNHHPASRFAYRRNLDAAELYVDGELHHTTARFAKAICERRLVLPLSSDEQVLLELLVEQGSVGIAT